MKVQCDYCKSYINDYDERCPNCGAINSHLVRNANEAPKTIEELKQWYIDRKLPDENITRFFIGKNYQAPKAFGIYKNESTGTFVVYKNKADGTRTIRYEGKDEVYAVNELYMKLKEEIVNQKVHNNIKNSQNYGYNPKELFRLVAKCLIIFFAALFVIMMLAIMSPSNGYYRYNNDYYYYQAGSWYRYDDILGWHYTEPPRGLEDNYSDYYDSSTYRGSYGIDDFKDSGYYKGSSGSSSSSWDSSSDWDSGSSWDSGSTDWSSDW